MPSRDVFACQVCGIAARGVVLCRAVPPVVITLGLFSGSRRSIVDLPLGLVPRLDDHEQAQNWRMTPSTFRDQARAARHPRQASRHPCRRVPRPLRTADPLPHPTVLDELPAHRCTLRRQEADLRPYPGQRAPRALSAGIGTWPNHTIACGENQTPCKPNEGRRDEYRRGRRKPGSVPAKMQKPPSSSTHTRGSSVERRSAGRGSPRLLPRRSSKDGCIPAVAVVSADVTAHVPIAAGTNQVCVAVAQSHPTSTRAPSGRCSGGLATPTN